MPYGCGEQNMASWSPNIYVLMYLTNTNQLTEKTEEEAKGYMRVGEWYIYYLELCYGIFTLESLLYRWHL